jgi:hypothetical protein
MANWYISAKNCLNSQRIKFRTDGKVRVIAKSLGGKQLHNISVRGI